MKLKLLFVFTLAFLLQACAVGPQRTLLSQTDRESIKTLDLYNLIIQDEFRPAIEVSNVTGAMGGGLIPALIDSSVNKNRNNASQDITESLFNSLDNTDFRQILASEINPAVNSLFQLKSQKELADSVILTDPQLRQKVMALADGEYLLSLSTFYGLMENSKALNVETVAMVFKKTKSSSQSKMPKPVYFNRLTYISAAIGNGGIDSINSWNKDNAKLFVDTLNESAKEIAKGLKYDLQNNIAFECVSPVTVDVYGFNGIKLKTKSLLIEQKETRAMVRAVASGTLYSIAGKPIVALNKNSKCDSASAKN